MENVSNNKVLCLNDEAKISRKKAAILELLEKGVDILAIFDTETTGLNVYPNLKAGMWRDRILEVGFIMYYRDGADGKIKPVILDGEPVTFQEYVNPFRESEKQRERAEGTQFTDPEALNVHQIKNEFLFGKEEFNGIKLHKAAPTFAEMKPYMEDFLCLEELPHVKGTMHFVAHNGKKFDAPMLTEEMYLVDKFNPDIKVKRTFLSIMPNLIDTQIVMQNLFDKQDLRDVKNARPTDLKANYSMDYLAHVLDVKLTGRENFHGALLDSLILKNVLNELLKTPEWNKAKNKIKINTLGNNKTDNSIKPIPTLNNNQAKTDEENVVTIIKTDASMNEGTGTIKEYVAAAQEAGLNTLAMADIVSVSRFVEFYEECRKANIEPIIGTTFKIESENDIYNHINKNKESGATNSIFNVMSSVLNGVTGNNFNSIEEIVKEYNVPVATFEKTTDIICELNKKSYSARETSKTAMDKLVEKVARNIVTMIGEKYNKDTKTLIDLSLLENMVLSDTSLIKYKPFTRATGHSDLLIIANNDEGFHTLRELITKAHETGQHWLKKTEDTLGKGENPLLKIEDIHNTDNITAVIGHHNDNFGNSVKFNDLERSKEILNKLQEKFGNNVKCQLTTSEQTTNRDDENKFLEKTSRLCQENGIESIATHYASFANKADFKIHVNKYALLTGQTATNVTIDSGKTKEEYIQTKELLSTKFSLNKYALSNADIFVKNNTLKPVLHQPSLPTFKTGNKNNEEEELYERALEGLKRILPSSFKRAVAKGKEVESKENYKAFCLKYKERLDYELGIINDMDFPGYFLITKKVVDFCKREGILVGAGRGSAAGSLVVHTLGITAVDPIEHGLIFERFLNPERKEMPDIDTDVIGSGREKLLRFLCEEFEKEGLGYSGAAFIMTKGTYSAKNTIQDMAKSYGMNLEWAKGLSDMVSGEPDTKLKNELENNELLIERYNTESFTRNIINSAMELEKNGGRQKSIGKHAGGVVVGNLVSQAPITNIGGIPVVQADKNDIETMGAVKFDFLGLSTLPKLALALELIKNRAGMETLEKTGIKMDGLVYDFTDFDYDDEATFKMLQEGNSSNVFQIESSLFKGLLKQMKPDSLDEIVALVALGRPGPIQSGMTQTFIDNKFNPEGRELYHPLIDHLLDETHGTIVYQEQVMAIAQKLAGFTMGGADKLRKAMGKKDADEMARQKGLFVEGASKNGVSEELSTKIYDTIEKFAGYGFNKSHALAYGVLTYQMAYLRRHFPTDVMAAICSIDASGTQASAKLPKNIQSGKEVNLTYYTPHINKSNIDFMSGAHTGVLYGLSGIKGATFTKVIEEREKNGNFTNLENFMSRCGAAKSVELLIDSGAMDSLQLMHNLDINESQYIQSLDEKERAIAKRVLLKEEYRLMQPALSTAEKVKKYVVGSCDLQAIRSKHKYVVNTFKENKAMIMIHSLYTESELLGGYITAHPLDIGNTREILKNNATNAQIKLNHLELDTVKQLDNKYSVAGCITELKGNLTSKAGKSFAIIEVSDETSITPMFLKADGFQLINDQIKQINNVGLEEGDTLGFDISFYEDKKSNEIRASVDAVYSLDNDVKISLKDDDNVKKFLNNKQGNTTKHNNTSRSKYKT